MMFGFRDEFSYFECAKCGCLQIAEVPNDLSKYYPRNYYSFNSSVQLPKATGIRLYLRQKQFETGLFRKGGLIGKLLYASSHWQLPDYSLSQVSLVKASRILDVGCGNGYLLDILHEAGFKDLMGVDPYIEAEIERDGTRIRKGTINDISGKWDLVMFNHSFEHMPDQLETLRKTEELLDKKGVCLINMPTASSYAWKHYRENWGGIDAPRHLFIHSVRSMALLAQKANLALQKVTYNSIEAQFWASEQCLKDIPLLSESSYAINPAKSTFSKKQIETFKQKTKELNRTEQGDQAAFLLVSKHSS